MTDENPQPQKTTPKGKDVSGRLAKPIDMPGLKRKVFDAVLRRVAKTGKTP